MSVGSFYKQSAKDGMITLQPSSADLDAFKDFAAAVPKAAIAAQRRAINKTLRWLRTHIARTVGRQERIAVAAVRQRLRAYPVSGGTMRGKLWFGLDAISASRIGRARQSHTGVSVAGRRYQGRSSKRFMVAVLISGSDREQAFRLRRVRRNAARQTPLRVH